MNEEKIDLSALDPSVDEQHWEQLIHSVTSKALAQRAPRLTVAEQLFTWARPALVAAALLAVAIWAGAMTATDTWQEIAEDQEEPAFILASWAMGDELPSTQKILSVVGGNDAAQ